MSSSYLPECIISGMGWGVKRRKARGEERASSLGWFLLKFLHSCDKALCCASPPRWLGQAWAPPVNFIHIRDRAVLRPDSAAGVPVGAVRLGSNS